MSRPFSVVVVLAVLLVGALALIALLMHPPREDLALFALLLGIPVVAGGAGATIARRQAWWRHFRSVAVALFITNAISAGLILITVFVTARLMFISAHDANLALLVVVFATAVTLVFGYFVAAGLREGIGDIMGAAQAVRQGDYSVAADARGNDELAELARTFNQMTAQLRSVREQESRLNAARRDLIAWVSHDLRTPLTAIRARIEAIQDGIVNEPAEVAAYLDLVRNDTYALSRLIDDLFELAVIDAGGLHLDKMACSLSDLVSDNIRAMSVLADTRRVRLAGQVAPDVGLVNISPQHVQRVLNNLVGNALAHTHAGGSVTVYAAIERQPAAVKVRVVDTGEGIAQDDLPYIFERFYRGERSRARGDGDNALPAAGMGLGLAIARALVEAHGGRIGAESQPGAGTTVWFTLPL